MPGHCTWKPTKKTGERPVPEECRDKHAQRSTTAEEKKGRVTAGGSQNRWAGRTEKKLK